MKTPKQLGIPPFIGFASAYFSDLMINLKDLCVVLGLLLSPLWFPFFYAGWYGYLLLADRKSKKPVGGYSKRTGSEEDQ